MKTNWAYKVFPFLVHPAALALPIAIVIALLMPDIFQKYEVSIIKQELLPISIKREYHDLDNDGISEFFNAGNEKNGAYLTLYNQFGTIDQWNFNGYFNGNDINCIVGDFDNDKIKEIYPLILRNDSLFINAIDFRFPGKFIFKDRFLIRIKAEEKAIISIKAGKLTDLNGDAYKELVFVVQNGFGLNPRRIVAYDIKNDSIFMSPELGIYIFQANYMDIDEDGKDEIAISNYGSANYKDTIGIMHDRSAYLMVLDNNLKFYFKPIEYKGDFYELAAFPLLVRGKNRIVTLSRNAGIKGNHNQELQILDTDGNIIKKQSIPFSDENHAELRVVYSKKNPDKIYLIKTYESISLLNEDLSVIKKKNIAFSCITKNQLLDLDNDGNIELLFHSTKPGEYLIVRDDLSHPVSFTVDVLDDKYFINVILRGEQAPHFSFQIQDRLYIMEYAFNPMYYWRYPIYFLIFLSLYGFISFIRRVQRFQLKKKYENEKKIIELELVSLRNQMDPHFTFNVLNTIGSLMLQKKNDKSYELLMKFSKMIRTALVSSSQLCRPLEEELDFVKSYIEVQQTRYQHLFEYSIEVDPSINIKQYVPKMVLQTHVENAIKHGLVPKKELGLLKIKIDINKDCIELSVIDNGIGRAKAKENESVSTGLGLKIMQQYYKILNQNNTNKITQQIIDLQNEEGITEGTKVLISIPLVFVFPDQYG